MLVFRIAGKKYIRDLTGLGAKQYGGRWNLPGTAILYTSETRALAMIEFLVHLAWPNLPKDSYIATLTIPEAQVPEILSPNQLPKNWRGYPAPENLAHLGVDWARSNRSLTLRVPSAVVDQEYNLLINPAHPDLGLIKILKVEELKFDRRLGMQDNENEE
jgi:RES domain-containing protein